MTFAKDKLGLLTYLVLFSLIYVSCRDETIEDEDVNVSIRDKAIEVLKDGVLQRAAQNLLEKPITVTASKCERSAGSIHDFYSEGDYWWPDPEDPDGEYIRKDGQTNPENFLDHRKAVMRFSQIVGNLTSAYIIEQNPEYIETIKNHLSAWFIDRDTKMFPNLLYSQAIKGRNTGRSIGVIDGIHFVEVAKAVEILEDRNLLSEEELIYIKQWFSDFLLWLKTHPFGIREMIHSNNHSTCWNLQAGMFARLIEDEYMLDFCRNFYTSALLPCQMAEDGSFPLEMARTKPYGYALFNLDAMAANCAILSDEDHNLWNYTTFDGKNIREGIEFMAPYVKNKANWPKEPDVMYWENWPIAHPSFIIAAEIYNSETYFNLWNDKEHYPEVFEVVRNVPLRNPLLWLE